ncbi:putative ribosome-binding factor A, mitochondrial [Bombina bombina]|uniref:putative ribosome-binding factor A, mitochondrial n=1 Tax=Bombina bombina TaxID=8345 RepID=UPI00235A891D|nr:putative ribosome-binding factor A, mitochondrial [Bombina bombina]
MANVYGGMCVCRAVTQRVWPGRGCARLFVPSSRMPVPLGPELVIPFSLSHRQLHLSSALNRKNLLNKFSSKSKKKFWYDSSSLGNQFVNKPPLLASLMRVQRKEKREDSIRIRALNTILYKALTDLLKTSEVSQEVSDLNVELSKVSVSVDFSACRAYWITSGNDDRDSTIEKVLQKFAPRFRHLLITYQVLGSVPPVVFVRDKEDAMLQKVQELLAIADFGPDDVIQHADKTRELFFPETEKPEYSDSVSPFPTNNMFGIDHEDLNRQIVDYKKKMKDRLKEHNVIGLSQQQQEQLEEIKKHKVLKKKLRKQKESLRYDDDVTPQKYLLSKYSDLDMDEEEKDSSENELETELLEYIEKLEVDTKNNLLEEK